MPFNSIPGKTLAMPMAMAIATMAGTTASASTDGAARRDHAVTIYSRLSPGAMDPRSFQRQIDDPDTRQQIPGYAIVRTRDSLELAEGVGSVDFTAVAAGLDPTTVKFESLTDPGGTRVLQQNFLYDLASANQMLARYIDQQIEVHLLFGERTEIVAGRLLAARGGDLLIETERDGVVSVADSPRNIRFPALAEGLLTKPTLRWEVAAGQGGAHEVQLTYETLGMTWWTDYTVVQSDAGGCTLDLSAWVSIVNQSGGSFDAARLKLVAGEVNRAPEARRPLYADGRMARATLEMASPAFEEQSLFEYHLYTLDRRVDLPDRSLKQLELFAPKLGVPCDRMLRVGAPGGRYYGGRDPYVDRAYPMASGKVPVEAFLAFDNSEAAGLGLPLPKGRIRVSRRDPVDGALEFIGEDNIDHTAKDGKLSLKLGSSFDVVAHRSQADFAWDKAQRWIEETLSVELRNSKGQDEVVEVDENLYRWSNWKIQDPSHPFERRDADSVRFTVPVPAGETVVLRYVARYDW